MTERKLAEPRCAGYQFVKKIDRSYGFARLFGEYANALKNSTAADIDARIRRFEEEQAKRLGGGR